MAHINFSKEDEALHEILNRNNSAVHYRTPITCVNLSRNELVTVDDDVDDSHVDALLGCKLSEFLDGYTPVSKYIGATIKTEGRAGVTKVTVVELRPNITSNEPGDVMNESRFIYFMPINLPLKDPTPAIMMLGISPESKYFIYNLKTDGGYLFAMVDSTPDTTVGVVSEYASAMIPGEYATYDISTLDGGAGEHFPIANTLPICYFDTVNVAFSRADSQVLRYKWEPKPEGYNPPKHSRKNVKSDYASKSVAAGISGNILNGVGAHETFPPENNNNIIADIKEGSTTMLEAVGHLIGKTYNHAVPKPRYIRVSNCGVDQTIADYIGSVCSNPDDKEGAKLGFQPVYIEIVDSHCIYRCFMLTDGGSLKVISVLPKFKIDIRNPEFANAMYDELILYINAKNSLSINENNALVNELLRRRMDANIEVGVDYCQTPLKIPMLSEFARMCVAYSEIEFNASDIKYLSPLLWLSISNDSTTADNSYKNKVELMYDTDGIIRNVRARTYARNTQDVEAIIDTDKDAGVIKCNGVVIPEPSLSEVFKVMYNIKGGVMKW